MIMPNFIMIRANNKDSLVSLVFSDLHAEIILWHNFENNINHKKVSEKVALKQSDSTLTINYNKLYDNKRKTPHLPPPPPNPWRMCCFHKLNIWYIPSTSGKNRVEDLSKNNVRFAVNRCWKKIFFTAKSPHLLVMKAVAKSCDFFVVKFCKICRFRRWNFFYRLHRNSYKKKLHTGANLSPPASQQLIVPLRYLWLTSMQF